MALLVLILPASALAEMAMARIASVLESCMLPAVKQYKIFQSKEVEW